MAKVKENYFKTKCMPAGILLNVNVDAVICLKFKLQLEFRNNKNDLCNCKFSYRSALKNVLIEN